MKIPQLQVNRLLNFDGFLLISWIIEEFDPVKQLDFENDLFELYPKFFDEGDDATTEVILTNISDKTYGTITLDALEALGRSRVKKNSNRYNWIIMN